MKRLMVVLMVAGVLAAAFAGVALAQTTPQGTEQTTLQGTEQTSLQGIEQTSPQQGTLDAKNLDGDASGGDANALDEGQAVAQAAPGETLDANNLDGQIAHGTVIETTRAWGQAFTAEHTGDLTGAQLFLTKNDFLGDSTAPGDLTVTIANVDADSRLPTVPEAVLSSTTIPSSTFPNNEGSPVPDADSAVDIDFEDPAVVVAGKQYALILKATGNVIFPPGGGGALFNAWIFGAGVDKYPAGSQITQGFPFSPTPDSWEEGSSNDSVFGIYVTPDTTPPEVSSTSPFKNQTGVFATANISATFLEEGSGIDRNTLTTETFKVVQVKPTGKVQVSEGTFSLDAESQTATFDPLNNLPKGLYQTTITTGVKDQAGNELTNDYTWTFATAGPPSRK